MTWPRRLAPLLVSQAFLWLTFLLFVFGPWQWPLRHPWELYAFVGGAHVALLLGYLSVAHRAPSGLAQPVDANRLIRLSLLINVLVLPVTCYARTGHWIPDILGGIVDPGRAYMEAHQYAENASNAASYLRIIAAPALVMLFPLGVYFWSRLRWSTRILTIGVMVGVVLMSLATGQRRDIADLLVTLPFVLMAAHCAKLTTLSRRTILTGATLLTAFLVVFTAYFTYSHVSRIGKEAAADGINPVTMQAPDLDNPILQALPSEAQPGAIGLLNYLTTGYYGLALAMDRPFEPMYGFGHSMFLTRNIERLANDESFESRSLPVQISNKDGFKYPVHWCTAYPYFANDLGFVGTVLMLFFVGRGLALSWIDMLGGRNAFAVVMFSLLMTLVMYLPATNRMLQDGEGVFAFYGWLALWGLSRLVPRPRPVLATA